MPDEVAETWPCYRLVREGWATLPDMHKWDGLTINDVDLANIAMNAVEDTQIRIRKSRK